MKDSSTWRLKVKPKLYKAESINGESWILITSYEQLDQTLPEADRVFNLYTPMDSFFD